MNQLSVTLKESDRVEILTIIDNYVDVLLENTDVVTRPPHAKGGKILTDTLLAEHGLSLLITVFQGQNKHRIFFDTGYTRIGVPHNVEQLEVDIKEIETIVLSHGHMDHTGSIYKLLDTIGKRIPLVVHPDAFLAPRYLGLNDGRKLLFPQTLVKADLEARNVELLAKKTPTLLADHRILVTGEVERVTNFEKGMPNALMERDGKLDKDPISDDQALVINLKGKGLVVIGGCSHAGIINTILYAQKMTGIEQVYAVLGGFHLSGPSFEPIIEETINELKKMGPRFLCLCTARAGRPFTDSLRNFLLPLYSTAWVHFTHSPEGAWNRELELSEGTKVRRVRYYLNFAPSIVARRRKPCV